MTTTLINTAAHSAGYANKLLLPHWAETVKIIPEAEDKFVINRGFECCLVL